MTTELWAARNGEESTMVTQDVVERIIVQAPPTGAH
jgi:hypothetical protein